MGDSVDWYAAYRARRARLAVTHPVQALLEIAATWAIPIWVVFALLRIGAWSRGDLTLDVLVGLIVAAFGVISTRRRAARGRSFQGPSDSPAFGRGRPGKRTFFSILWALAPIVFLGYVAPFCIGYAASKLRNRRLRISTAIYAAVLLAELSIEARTSTDSHPANAAIGALALCGMAASIQAFWIRRRLLNHSDPDIADRECATCSHLSDYTATFCSECGSQLTASATVPDRSAVHDIKASVSAPEPLSGLATFACILLAALVLMRATRIAIDAFGWHYYRNPAHFHQPDNVLSNVLNVNERIDSICLFGGVVVMAWWFTRLATNTEHLAPGTLRFPRWAATWSWFIPVVNLIWPVIIVRNVWAATELDPVQAQKGRQLITLTWLLGLTLNAALLIAALTLRHVNAQTGIESRNELEAHSYIDLLFIGWLITSIYAMRLLTRTHQALITEQLQPVR